MLIPGEHLLQKNSLLATLPTLAKEWRISFDLKPKSYNKSSSTYDRRQGDQHWGPDSCALDVQEEWSHQGCHRHYPQRESQRGKVSGKSKSGYQPMDQCRNRPGEEGFRLHILLGHEGRDTVVYKKYEATGVL